MVSVRWEALSRAVRRRALRWVWPLLPATWSEVPRRVGSAATQIARLTAASVVAYVVAEALSPGLQDLTAPLTALLVVQASTVGTLYMGLVRVGAVLTGVLVAVGLASAIRLSWWSLALAIAAALVLAKVLRLGEQSLEAPISAMLILAVSSPDLAAQVRVANTLVGTAVGIAFSLLVPVAIPNAGASDAVRRIARSQAALLDEVALTLGDRPPDPEEVAAWLAWTDDIDADSTAAASAVQEIEERRRLNPRALTVAKVHPGLRTALARLDRCLAAERALLVVVARQGSVGDAAADRPAGTVAADPADPADPVETVDPADPVDEGSPGADLRRAFAVVLDDLATGLRTFGDLVGAEYGTGGAGRVDESLDRLLQVVRETRAVLAELMIVDIDPRERTDLWILQGSVLAAVDQVLRQLDLERPGQPGEA
ncbi:FUSC family protein [Nakamurella endophytica]|uniref:FUSC family protein n=1 Tax=Nakamurella endophytica TaxID=1748367 RepID=UPI001663AE22|nr:FUSC family protein [Nakamurella endophytica]